MEERNALGRAPRRSTRSTSSPSSLQNQLFSFRGVRSSSSRTAATSALAGRDAYRGTLAQGRLRDHAVDQQGRYHGRRELYPRVDPPPPGQDRHRIREREHATVRVQGSTARCDHCLSKDRQVNSAPWVGRPSGFCRRRRYRPMYPVGYFQGSCACRPTGLPPTQHPTSESRFSGRTLAQAPVGGTVGRPASTTCFVLWRSLSAQERLDVTATKRAVSDALEQQGLQLSTHPRQRPLRARLAQGGKALAG